MPPKHRLTLNGLHGALSQKIDLFITIAVRPSNPTKNHLVHLPTSDFSVHNCVSMFIS
jgi:hypothetical protein